MAFQRVNRVQARGVDGRGVTIGALSDSYDTATTDVFGDPLLIHAAEDVASGDLPGTGNPRNPQPVVVIQDANGGHDEGRGMLQIAHDVAPGSKLCFATANGGQLNFANNIRNLADKSGPCGADVVVDDITYPDEPMFSDGVISDAIDQVAANGVSYFSSAGNQGQQNAWQSPVRLVPASVAGTNLNLDGADPALYDGGFQDANPGPGTDVAQTIKIGAAGGTIDFQWDDPVDPDGPDFGDSIFHEHRGADHTHLGAHVHVHPDPGPGRHDRAVQGRRRPLRVDGRGPHRDQARRHRARSPGHRHLAGVARHHARPGR